jgi:hypothetical protein
MVISTWLLGHLHSKRASCTRRNLREGKLSRALPSASAKLFARLDRYIVAPRGDLVIEEIDDAKSSVAIVSRHAHS